MAILLFFPNRDLRWSSLKSFTSRRYFTTHNNARLPCLQQVCRNGRCIYRTPIRYQHISRCWNNTSRAISDRIHSHVEHRSRFPHPETERTFVWLHCYTTLVSISLEHRPSQSTTSLTAWYDYHPSLLNRPIEHAFHQHQISRAIDTSPVGGSYC